MFDTIPVTAVSVRRYMRHGYRGIYEFAALAFAQRRSVGYLYMVQSPDGCLVTPYESIGSAFCVLHHPQPVSVPLLWCIRNFQRSPELVCRLDADPLVQLQRSLDSHTGWFRTDSSAVITPRTVYPIMHSNGVDAAVVLDSVPQNWYAVMRDILNGSRAAPGWYNAYDGRGGLYQRLEFNGIPVTLYSGQQDWQPWYLHHLRWLTAPVSIERQYTYIQPVADWIAELGYCLLYGMARLDVSPGLMGLASDVSDLPSVLRMLSWDVLYPALDGSLGVMRMSPTGTAISYPNPLMRVRVDWSADTYSIRRWNQYPLQEWSAIYCAPTGSISVDARRGSSDAGIVLTYTPFAIELRDGRVLCYVLPANGYPALAQECARRSAG